MGDYTGYGGGKKLGKILLGAGIIAGSAVLGLAGISIGGSDKENHVDAKQPSRPKRKRWSKKDTDDNRYHY